LDDNNNRRIGMSRLIIIYRIVIPQNAAMFDVRSLMALL